MSRSFRTLMFVFTGAGLLTALFWGMAGLPRYGHYPGPYGDVLNRVAEKERHVTNVVTSVNFDYRGGDTLGEEYILFSALSGLAFLLRSMRGEKEDAPRDAAPDRMIAESSDAVRWLGPGLIGVTNLYGIYIVLHAQLTPGGGFQGGAILGTAALLAYLATSYKAFTRYSPEILTELGDAVGAGMYAMLGIGMLMVGARFLQNLFPLGKTGALNSSGTIAAINFFVGLEVSAGFVLLFAEFLKETRKTRPQTNTAPESRDEKPGAIAAKMPTQNSPNEPSGGKSGVSQQ